MRQTDEELMIEFQNGNASGFDALIERYRGPVFAMIVNMLNDRIAAEDVFQDVFLKVIHSAHTYDPARAFAPWIFKITDNACLEALRRRKIATDEAPEIPAPQSDEPEQQTLIMERRRALARAVAALPENQRRTVALRIFADLPFDRIAEILGCPRNTVLSHMHRALAKLKTLLPEMEAHDNEGTVRQYNV